MQIRKATNADIPSLNRLLLQVLTVHHNGRPDLFRPDSRKYTDEELCILLKDESRPIFVAEDDAGTVQGYAFCIFQQKLHDNILTDIKTLYIDDLCVDKQHRGQHIGKALYELTDIFQLLLAACRQDFFNVLPTGIRFNRAAAKKKLVAAYVQRP